MSALITHASNQFREKRKRKETKKTQTSDQKPNKSHEKIT
jgi:hypothetical protein